MKIVVFYLFLFLSCVLISFQNNTPPQPQQANSTQNKEHALLLEYIARATKWIYTGDTTFEFEKKGQQAL